MPISSSELIKFPNRVFVETGSYAGDGIKAALKAGFQEIYSVDISPTQYDECCRIFQDEPRVHLYLDDCGTWLDKILNQIDEPCTIYLDANGWKFETEHPFDSAINALVRHGRQDHTIIVDDMNGDHLPAEHIHKAFADSNNGVAKQLRRINPNYVLKIMDSHTEDLQCTFPAWLAIATPH
jgi:hypothetical protein